MKTSGVLLHVVLMTLVFLGCSKAAELVFGTTIADFFQPLIVTKGWESWKQPFLDGRRMLIDGISSTDMFVALVQGASFDGLSMYLGNIREGLAFSAVALITDVSLYDVYINAARILLTKGIAYVVGGVWAVATMYVMYHQGVWNPLGGIES